MKLSLILLCLIFIAGCEISGAKLTACYKFCEKHDGVSSYETSVDACFCRDLTRKDMDYKYGGNESK